MLEKFSNILATRFLLGLFGNFEENPEPRIRLSCTNPKPIKEWKQLIFEMGISMSIMKDRRWWGGLGGLETRNKENIFRFKEIGGFLPLNVKVTKGNFKGMKKNTVLNMSVNLLNKK